MRTGYMTEALEKIEESGGHLAVDQSQRIVCPFCLDNRRTMSITRQPACILYHCFRASCDASGVLGTRYQNKTAPPKPPYKPFDGEIIPVPPAIFEGMFGKYGLTRADTDVQGIGYAMSKGRVYTPLYNSLGFVVGDLFKATNTTVAPKTLIAVDEASDGLFFPLGYHESETLVLVEDFISALVVHKASKLAVASLCGAALQEKSIDALVQSKFERVKFFLDGDFAGTQGAVKGFTRLAPRLSGGRIAEVVIPPTGLDPKDLSKEDICQYLNC